MRRSLLFIPGNTPRMLMNASDLHSDSIILDIEDSVLPEEKDSARILIGNAIKMLDYSKCEIFIRINSIDTDFWKDDLIHLVPLKPKCFVIPKVDSFGDISIIDEFIREIENSINCESNSIGLIPIIETALGVENAYSIAKASKRVKGLLLGAEDLTYDLRCIRTKNGIEISYSRSRLVIAARAAGIEAYDTPYTDLLDEEGLINDAQYARSIGFSGKAAISPSHIGVINKIFSPNDDEIKNALEIINAVTSPDNEGYGVIKLNGKMIDKPVIQRAVQIIENAKELGILKE